MSTTNSAGSTGTEPTVQNDDQCGAPTDGGDPCSLSPTRPDGRCHLHTATEDVDAGRPSKFTEARARDVLEAAREGISKNGCARAAGVDPRTLDRWLDDADHAVDGVRFEELFLRARAEGELRLIRGGLEGDIPASMARFMLERSFGYTKKEKVEHSGEIDWRNAIADFSDSKT